MAHQARPLQFVKMKGNRAALGAVARQFLGGGGAAGINYANSVNTKYVTENLSFPLNVDSDSQEGHYIIFTIKEQNKAKLAAWKPRQAKTEADIASEVAALAKTRHMTVDAIAQEVTKRVAANGIEDVDKTDIKIGNTTAGLNNSIQMSKNATTDLKAVISIYMPASVKVSYQTKYGEQEIGLLAETGAAAIKKFMETQGGVMDKLVSGATAGVEGIGQGLKVAGIKALEGVAPGAAALIAISRGKIITPRMELMFEGVGRREFSYEFTFIPKSSQEADHIEGIVTRFKHAMAADYSTGNIAGVDVVGLGAGADGVREMDIPSFFDITYMYKGKENNHLNKISTCVLRGMDVTYGADRFKTYAGGVPQTTQISLNFSELNIITKKHIEAGY
jgi:hypothetical protein